MPKGIGYGKRASKITGMPMKELARMKQKKEDYSDTAEMTPNISMPGKPAPHKFAWKSRNL